MPEIVADNPPNVSAAWNQRTTVEFSIANYEMIHIKFLHSMSSKLSKYRWN